MLPLRHKTEIHNVGVRAAAEGSSQSAGGAPNRDIVCIDVLQPRTESVEESGGTL